MNQSKELKNAKRNLYWLAVSIKGLSDVLVKILESSDFDCEELKKLNDIRTDMTKTCYGISLFLDDISGMVNEQKKD
jgi:hypothetical protein